MTKNSKLTPLIKLRIELLHVEPVIWRMGWQDVSVSPRPFWRAD